MNGLQFCNHENYESEVLGKKYWERRIMQKNRSTPELLSAWRTGDLQAFDELIAMIFPVLTTSATKLLRGWPSVARHWEPGDLVNEACISLQNQNRREYKTRKDLERLAAFLMKNALRDYKSRLTTQKRGWRKKEISLGELNTDC